MIDIICEKVDNLSGAEPEPAETNGPDYQSNPLRLPQDLPKSSYLPVDHVTKCYPYLHAQSQHSAIVEMLEDGRSEGREGQCRSIDVGHD